MATNFRILPDSSAITRLSANELPGGSKHFGFGHTSPEERARRVGVAHDLNKSGSLTTVFTDGMYSIATDDPTNFKAADGKKLAALVVKAGTRDLTALKWSAAAKTKITGGGPVQIMAMSKAGFDNLLGGDATGVAGVTLDGSHVAVPLTLANNPSPDDLDTIAHELTHMMQNRVLTVTASNKAISLDIRRKPALDGKQINVMEQDGFDAASKTTAPGKAAPAATQNRMALVPDYTIEGQAYTAGDAYPQFLKLGPTDAVLPQLAQAISEFKGTDASYTLKNYGAGVSEGADQSHGFQDEILGAAFVNFMGTHKGNPTAKPVAYTGGMSKWASVFEQVGNGASYDAAFSKAFGMDKATAEKNFVTFMTNTEGDAKARLAKTVWDGFLPAAGSSTSPAKSVVEKA